MTEFILIAAEIMLIVLAYEYFDVVGRSRASPRRLFEVATCLGIVAFSYCYRVAVDVAEGVYNIVIIGAAGILCVLTLLSFIGALLNYARGIESERQETDGDAR